MKENGVNIMDIDVNNSKQKQYEYLKNHAIAILEEIINDFKEDELQKIYDRLEFSDAGDVWGNENYFINFTYKEDETMDLEDIIEKMAKLKDIELILTHY